MICIRRARPEDAAAIGAVHVATWRGTYAGVLPDTYLAQLSVVRQAAHYSRGIADRSGGHAVFVAVASGVDAPPGRDSMVVGFTSGGRCRRPGLAEGEIETLYLLEDYRERGIGRRLLRAMAAHLAVVGCGSAMLWVLAANPTRFFYQHLGGRAAAREVIHHAGVDVEQLAFVWDPIEALRRATAPAGEG